MLFLQLVSSKYQLQHNMIFTIRLTIVYYFLHIGGNYDKCIFITIRPKDSEKSNEILLSWTEVIGKECTAAANEHFEMFVGLKWKHAV